MTRAATAPRAAAPLGAGGHDARADATLAIGEVLSELAEEFPTLTPSKVRFLEERGLIHPQRTPAGYRQFRPSDVDRLRLVLVLQRDHHLPLKAIRDYLAAMDGGAPTAPPGIRPTIVRQGSEAEPATRRPVRLRRREFMALTGASAELLDDLARHGLVVASSAGFYNQQDLDVTVLAVEMAQFGIEARHLRAFKQAADREMALVEQVTLPLRRQRDDTAEQVTDDLLGLCVRLHAALLGIGSARPAR